MIVFFTAPWCLACKSVYGLIEGYNHKIVDVGTDIENQNLAVKEGVYSFPTVIFYSGEKEVFRHIGIFNKGMLESWVKEYV